MSKKSQRTMNNEQQTINSCWPIGLRQAKTNIIIVFLLFFIVIPFFAEAEQIGEKRTFFIESIYDKSERQEISAILVKTTSGLYFYIDEKWWNFSPRNEIYQALSELGEEFEKTIYPGLTSVFGSEWSPGIDKDKNITVLLHSMKDGASGYFRTEDEYSRLEAHRSNQREMIYLNADHITSSFAKSFLAHEFIHLITFNQKDKIRGVEEEIWLNEARAEYAPSLLGYDDDFKGSYLEQRVNVFLKNPSDSLPEWQGKSADYGALNIFIQYLTDHYGEKILIDSLHSQKVGIPSLNEALLKNNAAKDFAQIFNDWAVAVLLNDCDLGTQYCYLDKNLKDLRVIPLINYLPMTGESALSVTDTTKTWAGNWYKLVGGRGDLTFEFMGNEKVGFEVIYVLRNVSGAYTIDSFSLKEKEKAKFTITDFGTENVSLTVIPIIQNKILGFNGFVSVYRFSWSASVTKNNQEPSRDKEQEQKQKQNQINALLAQIEELKKQIVQAQAKITAILGESTVAGDSTIKDIPKNFSFTKNLEQGANNQEVKYLQILLNSDKNTQLAGSGLGSLGQETNYFGPLTKAAVIKFQEKYMREILAPWNLINGTGYVGNTTRAELNKLLQK